MVSVKVLDSHSMVACSSSRDVRRERELTVAVCLECGEMKLGAWTPCASCGYTLISIDNYLSYSILKQYEPLSSSLHLSSSFNLSAIRVVLLSDLSFSIRLFS
jgi:hypothetical protein